MNREFMGWGNRGMPTLMEPTQAKTRGSKGGILERPQLIRALKGGF